MKKFLKYLLIAIAAALVLGIVIGRSETLEQTFYPIIVFFQAVPKVALAPLWLIVFGFGVEPIREERFQ